MQQWQTVVDACNELTGVTDWVLDPVNNTVQYKDKPASDEYNNNEGKYTSQYKFTLDVSIVNTNRKFVAYDALTLCSMYMNAYNGAQNYFRMSGSRLKSGSTSTCQYDYKYFDTGRPLDDGLTEQPLKRVVNPAYDPANKDEIKTLLLETVAQRIISNTASSNQAVSLLAEAYLENMAQSIFSTDESKQFVKLSDLTPQFELNKILAN